MGLGRLFLTFLKIGSVLYGSGYVLLAFLESEFIRAFPVISEKQLLDAVAIGQLTPGPVFTAATFIGYLILGIPGALVSTAGIFLPSFLLVWLLKPLIPKIRQSKWAGGILDGVNIASLGLMTAVTVRLGMASLIDLLSVSLFALSLFILTKYKINSAWIIIGGGVIGFISQLL
jgi:chromate transporter